MVTADPGMSGVGGNDPERFDFAIANAVDNLVVSETVLVGNTVNGNVEQGSDLPAMLVVGELMSTEKAGRVAEET